MITPGPAPHHSDIEEGGSVVCQLVLKQQHVLVKQDLLPHLQLFYINPLRCFRYLKILPYKIFRNSIKSWTYFTQYFSKNRFKSIDNCFLPSILFKTIYIFHAVAKSTNIHTCTYIKEKNTKIKQFLHYNTKRQVISVLTQHYLFCIHIKINSRIAESSYPSPRSSTTLRTPQMAHTSMTWLSFINFIYSHSK